MGLIGLRNGHFQKAKRVILDYVIGYNISVPLKWDELNN